MSSWRDGLEGEGAWLGLVGEISVEEFLASSGTGDIREACRAHAEQLHAMLPEEIPELSEEDIEWATDVLSAYAERHRRR